LGDRMHPIPFDRLMEHIVTEYRQEGSVFGITNFFRADPKRSVSMFGERMETPVGPAAGPHTQLAQNIVSAYLCGARFFELKTVQTLDGEDLPVEKPCILAEDEGYNVEWSTELRVGQALDEYIKAWFALKLLSKEFSLGGEDGFIFNMSVGYDLKGIQSPKIDAFIEGLKDASGTEAWRECQSWALSNAGRFSRVDEDYVRGISPKICSSITLSTLHGCPPDEIERIAVYLLREKKLHTFVKCNPTLLGYDFARTTLDRLGYGYISFDDTHFKSDLQFSDAVPMFQRLSALAAEENRSFGVKLSNTFPVDIKQNELPGQEMYMSGRALYPLTTALALRISEAFAGKLPVSYSGGANLFNVEGLLKAGIRPVTIATDLLKPGGYQRLLPVAQRLSALSLPEDGTVSVPMLRSIAAEAAEGELCRKPEKPAPPRKIERKVPLLNCYVAPCRGACPIGQDIPAYLRCAEEGNFEQALRVIFQRNPLPFITGSICPHPCTTRCNRAFYEGSVDIRQVKLEAALEAGETLLRELKPPAKSGKRVAVVGGGPAGISAACFLARAGAEVTVFERRRKLGGLVRYVIPEFRISQERIDRDIAFAEALGVRFQTGREIDSVASLREIGFGPVVLAVGAWRNGKLPLAYGEAMNALEFLSRCKASGDGIQPGRHVAVIGGGNTAMDVARAALRMPGVERVFLVYRRTRRYMPAEEEELQLALLEGVELHELLAPVGVRDGVLTCRKMRLGEPDASNRRSVVETEETIELPADLVVAAIGEQVDSCFFKNNGIALDKRGLVAVNRETLETNLPGVYAIGDALTGPATVVEAIASAARCARAIAGADYERYAGRNAAGQWPKALAKKGALCASCSESGRCLDCETLCELCADVCPNRANVAVAVGNRRQILHVDALCNECGNCSAFCPYDSAPYREKFTLFSSAADFEDSENQGFLPLGAKRCRVRLSGEVMETDLAAADTALPEEIRSFILAVLERYAFLK